MSLYSKWGRLKNIIWQNGGLFKSLYKTWRFDTLKEGQLRGKDAFGNKYYENNNYMVCRNRWVEYNQRVGWDYDASQVTPEWYGWLHHKTDRIPSEDYAKYCVICDEWSRRWLLQHQENLSGTDKAYYPYSTTMQRINIWNGSDVTMRLKAK